jgi:ATP/maltotriose-dependent transcriptional regulator MalT
MAAWERGDLPAALDLGLRAVAAEAGGHRNIDQFAYFAIYSAAHFSDDPELATEYLQRAAEAARTADQRVLEALHTTTASIVEIAAGRSSEGLALARRARRIGEARGNPQAICWAMGQEGVALALLRDPSAEHVLRHGLTIAEENGSVLAALVHQRELAMILTRLGRIDQAVPLLLAGLRAMRRKGSWMFANQTLVYAARLLIRAGVPEPAAVLCGTARASSAVGDRAFASFVEKLRPPLEGALGGEQFESLARLGEEMPIERAVAYAEQALTGLVGSRPTPYPGSGSS